MAKKPDAARGKTTRKGKIRKIVKNFLGGTGRPKSKPRTMSPGAMGGATPPRRGRKLTPELKTKIKNVIGRAASKMPRGAGASGIGMAGQAMKLAKKLKPSGRLNVDDLRRAQQMMMKRKGK